LHPAADLSCLPPSSLSSRPRLPEAERRQTLLGLACSPPPLPVSSSLTPECSSSRSGQSVRRRTLSAQSARCQFLQASWSAHVDVRRQAWAIFPPLLPSSLPPFLPSSLPPLPSLLVFFLPASRGACPVLGRPVLFVRLVLFSSSLFAAAAATASPPYAIVIYL